MLLVAYLSLRKAPLFSHGQSPPTKVFITVKFDSNLYKHEDVSASFSKAIMTAFISGNGNRYAGPGSVEKPQVSEFNRGKLWPLKTFKALGHRICSALHSRLAFILLTFVILYVWDV